MGQIADSGLILGTGHLSVSEINLLFEEASRVGVKKILVTHPENRHVNASIDEQREMARKECYREHCYLVTTPKYENSSMEYLAEAIGAVGPKRCVISTDLGQVYGPSPVEGMKKYIREMLGCGMSENDIRLMIAENPSELLGLRDRSDNLD